MADFVGRLGRARHGEHRGWYVEVERDPSNSGWHLWLLDDDPRVQRPSSRGWDIWADDDEQLTSWLSDRLDVEWIDEEPTPSGEPRSDP